MISCKTYTRMRPRFHEARKTLVRVEILRLPLTVCFRFARVPREVIRRPGGASWAPEISRNDYTESFLPYCSGPGFKLLCRYSDVS